MGLLEPQRRASASIIHILRSGRVIARLDRAVVAAEKADCIPVFSIGIQLFEFDFFTGVESAQLTLGLRD